MTKIKWPSFAQAQRVDVRPVLAGDIEQAGLLVPGDAIEHGIGIAADIVRGPARTG